jgi:hypothetical protein
MFTEASQFLELLLHIVRRLGTYVARHQARRSISVNDEKTPHNLKVLYFWRSDAPITYSLINSALELLQEAPQSRILHLRKKRFSPAHQQAPPRWIRDKAADSWELIQTLTNTTT